MAQSQDQRRRLGQEIQGQEPHWDRPVAQTQTTPVRIEVPRLASSSQEQAGLRIDRRLQAERSEFAVLALARRPSLADRKTATEVRRSEEQTGQTVREQQAQAPVAEEQAVEQLVVEEQPVEGQSVLRMETEAPQQVLAAE